MTFVAGGGPSIRWDAWAHRARDPALSALLVVQILFVFVASPLASLGMRLPSLIGGGLCIALLALLVIVSQSRLAIALVLCSCLLGATGLLLRIRRPVETTEIFGHLASIVALLSLSLVVARAVFRPGRIAHHRIEGAIVLYLNVAMMFSSAYRLLNELVPGAFGNVPSSLGETDAIATMLYFSFTTLTSTGYGDIIPLHPAARSLANLEAIIGQLYPATLLARIVTLELKHRKD